MSLLLGLRQLLGEYDDSAAPESDPRPDPDRSTVDIEAVPRRPAD